MKKHLILTLCSFLALASESASAQTRLDPSGTTNVEYNCTLSHGSFYELNSNVITMLTDKFGNLSGTEEVAFSNGMKYHIGLVYSSATRNTVADLGLLDNDSTKVTFTSVFTAKIRSFSDTLVISGAGWDDGGLHASGGCVFNPE